MFKFQNFFAESLKSWKRICLRFRFLILIYCYIFIIILTRSLSISTSLACRLRYVNVLPLLILKVIKHHTIRQRMIVLSYTKQVPYLIELSFIISYWKSISKKQYKYICNIILIDQCFNLKCRSKLINRLVVMMVWLCK